MLRRSFLIGLPLALSACGKDHIYAPDADIARVAYHDPGPPKLTLFTMRNTGTDNGAHTGLMISASQRVIFDPAGTFSQPTIPERYDVQFGITDRVLQYYISYHSRITYYTYIQEAVVPADVAEKALQLALVAGPVSKSMCTIATSSLLHQLPGFEYIHTTLFPDNLAKQFARYPGVSAREYRETDPDDKSIAARQIAAEIKAGL